MNYTDDVLTAHGAMGALKLREDSSTNFDLFRANYREPRYTFDLMLVNIIYMYGDIMVLSQHRPGNARDDIILHCKFATDGFCREFQQQINLPSLQNGYVSIHMHYTYMYIMLKNFQHSTFKFVPTLPTPFPTYVSPHVGNSAPC